MSIFFDVSEIIKFALRIEVNGERFYRHAAKMTEDNNMRQLFTHLANEEIEHKRTFENLLSKLEEYEPLESYPGEYLGYLGSHVDKTVFADEALDSELPQMKDTYSILDFGIQRELDSILYYQEMKNYVPRSQHNQIDKIIDEERKHFSQLSELRKKI